MEPLLVNSRGWWFFQSSLGYTRNHWKISPNKPIDNYVLVSIDSLSSLSSSPLIPLFTPTTTPSPSYPHNYPLSFWTPLQSSHPQLHPPLPPDIKAGDEGEGEPSVCSVRESPSRKISQVHSASSISSSLYSISLLYLPTAAIRLLPTIPFSHKNNITHIKAPTIHHSTQK